MSFDLLRIYHEMDWMARSIVYALAVMGLASLVVFFERAYVFAQSRRQSSALATELVPLLRRGDLMPMRTLLARYPASHLARMLAPAVELYHEQLAMLGPRAHASVVELVRRELERQHTRQVSESRRGFSVLASVGSVAPFVGLLGTVVGIIAAFGRIASTGSAGLSAVSGGISEALVVTALGLMIAIPAVLLFNALSSQADALAERLSAAAGELVDHLEFQPQRGAGHGERVAAA